MARGINKVILIGNLGRDPELRYMPSGGAVVNVSIATSESWKDKDSGESKERTEWHNVVFFNKLAEGSSGYLYSQEELSKKPQLQKCRIWYVCLPWRTHTTSCLWQHSVFRSGEEVEEIQLARHIIKKHSEKPS